MSDTKRTLAELIADCAPHEVAGLMAGSPIPHAVIDYTNHRGERGIRHIKPFAIRYGSSVHHHEDQWLLDAWDCDKGAERTFACRDIHSWGDAQDGREAVALSARITRLEAELYDLRVRDGNLRTLARAWNAAAEAHDDLPPYPETSRNAQGAASLAVDRAQSAVYHAITAPEPRRG